MRSATLESTHWRKSFLQNYESWMQRAIAETNAKEFKEAWEAARKSNPKLDENPAAFIDQQFEAIHAEISEQEQEFDKMKKLLEEINDQISFTSLAKEDKDMLIGLVDIALTSIDTDPDQTLPSSKLKVYLQYILRLTNNPAVNQNNIGDLSDDCVHLKLNIVKDTIAILSSKISDQPNMPNKNGLLSLCDSIRKLLSRLITSLATAEERIQKATTRVENALGKSLTMKSMEVFASRNG